MEVNIKETPVIWRQRLNVIEKLFEKSAQWKRPLDRIGEPGLSQIGFNTWDSIWNPKCFYIEIISRLYSKVVFFVWCEWNLHWLKNQPINYANYTQSLVDCLFISGMAYRSNHNTYNRYSSGLSCRVCIYIFISTIIYNPQPDHHFVACSTWKRLKPTYRYCATHMG